MNMLPKKSVIVIPARYGSTRFPGKPLTVIAGKTMLQRVFEIATAAAKNCAHTEVIIATDDMRIKDHALELDATVYMTPESCATGSDRALAACQLLPYRPDIIINFQGDSPLTPPLFLEKIQKILCESPNIDVVTPAAQLSWPELDNLRNRKLITPFSGTTAIVDTEDNALWFSKNIIPAIRNEAKLRNSSELSPVFGHIGLYGYTYAALEKFVNLPTGHYEELEGLEQLRILENGMKIKIAKVHYGNQPVALGVDTPEDAKKAEEILLTHESLAR